MKHKNITKLSKMSKEELIKIIINLDKHVEETEAKLRATQAKLEETIYKYEAKLAETKLNSIEKFGSKSEKIENVINEVEVELDKAENTEKKVKKPRKKPTESFVYDLEKILSISKVVDYDFEGNGVDRSKVKKFGEDETIKLEVEPIPFKVVKIIRPKYKDKNKIYQAPVEDVFPHSVLTPSLAANIIMYKYHFFVPLNRYSNYLEGLGIRISTSNLYNYIKRSADLLFPIYNEMTKKLVESKCINVDETTIKVLDVKNKSKCYVFAYKTSLWEASQVSIYEFNETRKTDKAKEMFKDYNGYLICDGYKGYDEIKNMGIKIQRCWVHIRRYFVDCIKILPPKEKVNSPVYSIVELINSMFKKEAEFKKELYSASQIKEARNTLEYKQILTEIDEKIKQLEIEKNKNVSKAVNYYLNIQDNGELYTFLDDGYIEIDNNRAERAVRPFVVARKNFLFCKTKSGAEITSIIFSLVQTAIANGLNAEKYIKYALENINKKEIENLVPWSDEAKNAASIFNENPELTGN
jgi:transposase